MTRKERREMRDAILIIRKGECALATYSSIWPRLYDSPGVLKFADCLLLAIEESDSGEHYRWDRDLLALSIMCSELGEVPND